MTERQFEIGNQIITYRISETDEASIVITGGRHLGSRLLLPETIDGYRVGMIGKKAFLGERFLTEIIVPATVTEVMDYSFAQCPCLKKIVFLNPEIRLSRGTFVDCKNIEQIFIGDEENACLAALMAALINRLRADYMLAEKKIGDADWYGKWDNELNVYLRQPDDEGYTDLVLCGEEDILFSLEEYIHQTRKNKSVLCLLRLMNHDFLSEANRETFTNYILSNKKGCPSDAAWQALLSEFSENMDYFQLFAEIGGIDEDNLDDMICDMGNVATETKAFLLEYRQRNRKQNDVFDMFQL